MIKPLQIADQTYPINLVQGPLAGVSCAPFRRLTWDWGKPAFSYTEMISCKTLIHKDLALLQRFVHKDPLEGPVCFQLSANNSEELALGTRIASDYGADLIDLNCGCPVKKIRSKQAGSHLLSEPSKIYQLIRAMKNNTDCPVSIKIRVDAHSTDKFNQDIAHAVQDAQADFITVHGRHWTSGYDIACSYQDIEFFVQALKIPVIGNGDIACKESLQRMLNTGCAGAMIGRAGVGQPWIIQQLINDDYQIPSNEIIGELFLQHINELCKLLNSEKFAILQARTMAKYYARGLSNKHDFCEEFNQIEQFEVAADIIEKYFIRPNQPF